MADLTNSSWSETDSSNTQPAPSGFPSGILPSQVGGVVRAMMGAIKRAYNHGNAMVSSTGSNNSYVLTYAQTPENYVRGEVYRFFANFTNTATATININGLGARSILRADGTALSPGEIVSGQVATVIFDGSNFLHQSVGSRFFKDNVSIAKDGDAILAIEDTSAPATTFRRKQIYSSKNVSGGNDWLFRQTRPSDGAFEDFVLKAGTGGTIWTTGNFNPDLKANLAGGAVFAGDLTTHRGNGSTGVLFLGNQSANGGRYLFYDGGNYIMPGAQLFVNGSQVWKRDDFNPDTKASLNALVNFGGITLNGKEGYIYSDANTNNLRFRSGANPNYKYAGLNDDGTFQNFSGGFVGQGDVYAGSNLRSANRVIVGEGQTASWIEMRDTDQGTRFVHNNSGYIGFLGSGADWTFRVGDDGAVWTKQFGDLNQRIEDRAAAIGYTKASEYYEARAPIRSNITSLQGMSGPLAIPNWVDIVRSGVMRWRMAMDGDGTFRMSNGDNGDNIINFGTNGAIWTKQFGDLNNRIEQRASDWSAARRDEAKTFATSEANRGRDEANSNSASNYFNKTTSVEQQVNNVTSFNSGAIDIVRGGVLRARWKVEADQRVNLQNGDNGTQFFSIGPGGDIWTRQFGDLNNRIEDRANAWATARRDEANSNTATNYANKTNGSRQDFKGDILVSKLEPRLKIDASNTGGYSLLVHTDNRLYIQKESGFAFQNNAISIGPGGDIWTAQFGDLSTRIETRARDFADDRAGQRIAKTGDTMTGDLIIAKANAQLQLLTGGVYRWGVMTASNAELHFRNADDGDLKMAIRPDGSLWTRQLGDLNNRIEGRAQAWANTRQANLGYTPVQQSGGANQAGNKVYLGWDGQGVRAQVDSTDLGPLMSRNWINPIIDTRLAYAGDLGSTWNENANNYVEPYNRAVITTLNFISSGGAGHHIGGARWRYHQKQDSYGNWYTVGYA